MIDFSLAIVNWNTRNRLDACLASIRDARDGFTVEVLVADNGSQDGSADMVRRKYPDTILVENGANLGFAKGHEPLFAHSRGRFHVLVNSDVTLKPGCLTAIARRMEADEAIGVLGCRLVDEHGVTQPGCRRFPNLLFQLVEVSGINRLFPRSPIVNAYKMGGFDHEHSREVDQVMGSMFVIRRALIDAIGILDTGYFMYYEEVDYCLRAVRAGFKVFYEADATVYHEGGGSSRQVRVLTIRRTKRSMRRYFAKNIGAWTWLPLVPIVSLDVVTHVIHALVRREAPWLTLEAYALGWWDFVRCRNAGS